MGAVSSGKKRQLLLSLMIAEHPVSMVEFAWRTYGSDMASGVELRGYGQGKQEL
jgi:hypothetical protein